VNAGDITQTLLNWESNPEAAWGQLTPAVYSELRRIATSLMRKERPGHTLQPTALINEAYVRMVRQEEVSWKDRAHFFGVAARVMRQILVDHARSRASQKRGAGAKHTRPGDLAITTEDLDLVLDLDEALNRMADWDRRKLEVIELHYFGGMKAEEIGEALNLTLPTVRRDLLLGRAWLQEQFA
jgi:RNA polymerase sigma-70 factor, ECF subfamily